MLCCVVFTKVAERLFELLLLLVLRGEHGGKFSNFVNSTTAGILLGNFSEFMRHRLASRQSDIPVSIQSQRISISMESILKIAF